MSNCQLNEANIYSRAQQNVEDSKLAIYINNTFSVRGFADVPSLARGMKMDI